MNLSMYSDDDILEEVKHRGFKIEFVEDTKAGIWFRLANKIKIGGIIFDVNK